MKHKGYTGKVTFDDDAGVFHGRVIGLRDVITFEGTTVAELRQAFHDSVDDYLDFCRERGEAPEKPASGKLVARLGPALHRKLALHAERTGKSLNTVIVELIKAGFRQRQARRRPGTSAADNTS